MDVIEMPTEVRLQTFAATQPQPQAAQSANPQVTANSQGNPPVNAEVAANAFINNIVGGGQGQPSAQSYGSLGAELGGGITDDIVKNYEAVTGRSFKDIADTVKDVFDNLPEQQRNEGKQLYASITDPYQKMRLLGNLYDKVVNNGSTYGRIKLAGGKDAYIKQLEERLAKQKSAEGAINNAKFEAEREANQVKNNPLDPDRPLRAYF